MSNNIPKRDELVQSYQSNWNLQGYRFNLTGRYEDKETAAGYAHNAPELSKQCVLVYEATITTVNNDPVLAKQASLLWYDAVKHQNVTGRIAYLYLLEVLPHLRGNGIGTGYANVQHVTLPNYGVSAIYLKAAYCGPRFWSKMGYTFIDGARFWMEYQEYCDNFELDFKKSMEDVDPGYWDFLRDSKIEYPMIKKLSDE